jgi:hypothetical protein
MSRDLSHRRPVIGAAGVLALAAIVPAQSQCTPPTRLATQEPFQSTHYYNAPGQNNATVPPTPQNLPANYRGHMTLCDLTANADLLVSRIDYKLRDDGSVRWNWGPAPGVPGGPGLVGQTATVEVYATPGTWQGTWTTPTGPVAKMLVPPGPGSPWTLLATGTLTVRPYTDHSEAIFATPFQVPVGTNGFAFVLGPVTAPVPHITYAQPPYALHPSLLLQASAPQIPLTASDQFLSITNEDLTNQAFALLPLPNVKSALFELHYTVAADAAWYTPYAAGCYDRPRSFYEEWQPGTFDLANTSLRLTLAGDTYAASASNSAIVPPVSAPLTNAGGNNLGDDDRTGVKPLGFAFPYPGGSTSSIVITSNGNVFLQPASSGAQNGTYEIFGVPGFLKGQPQLCALWADFDPSGPGDVHLDIDPSGAVPVARITWLGLPESYRPGTSNTVQMEIAGDGSVEFRYGAIDFVRQPGITGFNAAFFAHDPGPRDLSATLPFVAGDGVVPPVMGMDARPVVGTTPNMTLRDLPADTAGAVNFGIPIHGIDLFFAGMPGCIARVVPLARSSFASVGTTASVPLRIPNSRLLLGIGLTAQAIMASPGSNAAGMTVSNPVCVRVGN